MEGDRNMMMMSMNKKQTPSSTTTTTTTSSSSSLTMHKNSHAISKIKPKIRIIHIFAPEIIKTDAANFRELVQRLTGKPDEAKKKKKNQRTGTRKDDQEETMTKKMMIRERSSTVKEEFSFEPWNGHDCSSNGGFLGGFADLDGFNVQEFGEFPFLPLDAPHSLHVFDQEPQLIA